MKKVAIDLTWVRPNKVGGTESCVRNLLDGFAQIDTGDIKLILLVTEDNVDSFEQYKDCLSIDICDTHSSSQKERVIWQNTKMGKHLRKNDIKLCLEPVYGKPFFGVRNIDFITTIHDLQAIHYPQYFSRRRVAWMKFSWKNAVRSSKQIIAISEYVKKDIESNYPESREKIKTIYDAVSIDKDEVSNTKLLEDIGVKKQEYYYTVSSLFLHKNLKTIVKVIAELKKRRSKAFYPMVVSGIGGRRRDELDTIIKENGVEKDIIFTSFVSNAERNMLYRHCKVFLFPSIFEGFGMPPLEAAVFGAPVLTTRCTSIEEVTGGILNYVHDPMNVGEWVEKLEIGVSKTDSVLLDEVLDRYMPAIIAKQYIDVMEKMV